MSGRMAATRYHVVYQDKELAVFDKSEDVKAYISEMVKRGYLYDGIQIYSQDMRDRIRREEEDRYYGPLPFFNRTPRKISTYAVYHDSRCIEKNFKTKELAEEYAIFYRKLYNLPETSNVCIRVIYHRRGAMSFNETVELMK